MKRLIWRRLWAVVLALALMVPHLTGLAEQEPDVTGDKTATELNDDMETTVTLALPSGEYQNKVDIVFTMDSSSSAENGTVFIEAVEDLFDSILEYNPNLELKVGVIRFRGRAHDAVEFKSNGAYSGLTLYSDDTAQYIYDALTMSESEIKANFGNGSNTHGGLDIANEWLKADEEVEDDHKYVVLLTDGKTYIWNNDEHEPTTIYSQWYRSNSFAMQNNGIPALNQIAGYNKYDYAVDVLDPTGKSNVFVFKADSYTTTEAYEKLYASESEELTGVSEWDQPCLYADDRTAVPAGTYVKHNVTNGAELFGSNSATYGNRKDYQYWFEYTPNSTWEGVTYLEGNPFAVIDNGDGTYTFDTETINPNYYLYHVDCLQKGMYKAGHLWTEMNEKYNCAAVIFSGGSVSGGLELRVPFNMWLQEKASFGADITNTDQVKGMFADIDNSIRYMVNRGTVTDVIASDFTLKEQEADTFRMTLGGEDVPCTYDASAEYPWCFGEPDVEGVYPYTVKVDGNTITWVLNVPVENLNQVTLSYDLILREDAPSGVYDTNDSAVLDYTTSDDEEGQFVFPVPNVTYIEKMDITVIKEWDDGDDQDGLRPEGISVTLLQDGEPYGDPAVISEESDWQAVFESVPKHRIEDREAVEIVYSIEEEGVDGYDEPEISELDGETGVITVTNKHDPEVTDITVTKVWEDEDDKDGLRPDSVKVTLQADGKDLETVELKASEQWTYTFEGLPVYAAGEEITYTVKEDAVEGYEAEIKDFTITNRHTPETETETETEPATETETEAPSSTVPEEESPRTGVDSHFALWMMLIAVSLFGGVMLIARAAKKEND